MRTVFVVSGEGDEPKFKKKYKIPLTNRGGGGDEFEWDLAIFETRKAAEEYVDMGGRVEKIYEIRLYASQR